MQFDNTFENKDIAQNKIPKTIIMPNNGETNKLEIKDVKLTVPKLLSIIEKIIICADTETNIALFI